MEQKLFKNLREIEFFISQKWQTGTLRLTYVFAFEVPIAKMDERRGMFRSSAQRSFKHARRVSI